MRRDSDRRARPRLDVVGALWGTLETQKRAQVLDVNDNGALLLSPVHLPANTVHTIEVSHEGRRLSTEVLVRHVRPAQPGGSYHIGVEFLAHPLTPPLEV